jgi:hypothetical protein
MDLQSIQIKNNSDFRIANPKELLCKSERAAEFKVPMPKLPCSKTSLIVLFPTKIFSNRAQETELKYI